MRVLAFDTTMAACSVAVWQDGDVRAHFHQAMMHGQAEALLPAIEQTLSDANISYADLDRIAVTLGPGSFTGVRVGLATARGVGAAAGLPVIGLATTDVIAAEARSHTSLPIAVAVDARRAEVYLHLFGPDGIALEDPACALPIDAAVSLNDAEWAVAGDGAERVLEHCGGRLDGVKPHVPSAAVLAALAAERIAPADMPRPIYVRPPDAALPKHGGRLRP